MALDKDGWVKRALALKPEARMFINGNFVDAVSGNTFDDISPRDQRVIARINTFDMSDVITPFGWFKGSGSGRDKSLHALNSYSALKTTWVDLN